MGHLSVKLNNQICHHLFPTVHPCHYQEVRRVLIPVAAKHNIDYEGRSSFTFLDVLRDYFSWLSKLNSSSKGIAKASEKRDANVWGLMLNMLVAVVMFILPIMNL